MIEEIQVVNVKEFGEEIAEECYMEWGKDLCIDHIFKEVTNALHDGIKADIVHFAFKYLDDNSIEYKD